MVGQFWPGNILTNSWKMINEALKSWERSVFGNRDPSQPMEVALSLDFFNERTNKNLRRDTAIRINNKLQ